MSETNEDLDVQRVVNTMRMTTINLVTVIEAHRAYEGFEVMSGLMRFDQSLAAASDKVKDAIRGNPDPALIYDAMGEPLALAMRYGAEDLIAIAQRSYANFADLINDPNSGLTPEAVADVVVWLGVVDQTRVAVKMLFHTSMMLGRAPNGKRLDIK